MADRAPTEVGNSIKENTDLNDTSGGKQPEKTDYTSEYCEIDTATPSGLERISSEEAEGVSQQISHEGKEPDQEGDLDIVDTEDGEEQSLNAEIPTELEELYQTEGRSYTPLPVQADNTQAEIRAPSARYHSPQPTEHLQKTSSSPPPAEVDNLGTGYSKSNQNLQNSTIRLQKSVTSLRRSTPHLKVSTASLPESTDNIQTLTEIPNRSSSSGSSQKNKEDITDSQSTPNTGKKSQISFSGGSSVPGSKKPSIGGRFKKFVSGLVHTKMAASRTSNSRADQTMSALTKLIDDDANKTKLAKALECNPHAVEILVREFYRAETAHCKRMVSMWKGFQTDMTEVEKSIEEGQAIDALMLDVLELEGEQDGFELLNEVKDNPQMLVQPPEPRKSKPRKHKRKHRKDKERKREKALETAQLDLPGGVQESSEQKLDLKIFGGSEEKEKKSGVLGAINQYLNTD